VFVHDGLGSIEQWRDVPERVADTSGRGTLAYNRSGHGRATPVPHGPWPVDWMWHEAEVLATLVERTASEPVTLVGHSDGGTISLLCASARPELVADVIALAAHSWVEPKCVRAIEGMRRHRDSLVRALARFHDHPPDLFDAWSGVWTSPEFASWDVRQELGAVECPVTVVQGDDDEYASELMAWSTAEAIPNATVTMVPACRHVIHRDQPDLVVSLASRERGEG
jgi:pimeloyl-ACP methyl ester carboxylesterase